MKPQQFPPELQNVELWDAVIVGAGPSGTTLATALAKRGFSILLLDKADFPRHKVCGCCLSPMSACILEELGLYESIATRNPNSLNRIELKASGWQAVSALPSGGFAISRKSLDEIMLKRAKESGVVFVDRTTARPSSETKDGYCELKISRDGCSLVIKAHLTIIASGLHSFGAEQKTVISSDSYLGAGKSLKHFEGNYVPGTIYMALGSLGYTGLVLLEDGSLNIAAALSATLIKRHRGLNNAIRSILLTAGFEVPFDNNQLFESTPLLSRSSSTFVSKRLLSVGDNAKFVEPFTGEGIGWAMLSSILVFPAIEKALRDPGNFHLSEEARKYQKVLRLYHLRCFLMTSLLRSELMTKTIMAALATFPSWLRRGASFSACFNPKKIKELVRHVS
jgi:flavin-dependent dehydrogenase